MRLEQRTIPVNYVVLDEETGLSTPQATLLDILDGLADTDGFFNVIVIYEGEVARYLERREVVRKTSRGSYYKGPQYAAFVDEVENLKFPKVVE